MHKTKILFLNNYPVYGGVERQAEMLLTNLNDKIFDKHLLCFYPNVKHIENVRKIKDVKCYSFDSGLKSFSDQEVKSLENLLSYIKPDVVFTEHINNRLVPLLRAAKLVPRTKVINRVPHGLTSFFKFLLQNTEPNDELFKKCDNELSRIFGMCDSIVPLSKNLGRELVDRLSIAVSSELPYMVDISSHSSEAIYKNNKRYVVLFIGRLAKEKGLKHVIAAATAIPECEFWIVGEGPDGKYFEQKSFDVKNIKFWGFQENPYKFLNSADLLVLPSYSEGLPGVVIESFSAGIPVVATSVGAISELIDNSQFGRVVKTGDEKAFISAIREMMKFIPDKQLILKKAQDYSMKNLLPKHEELFLSVSANIGFNKASQSKDDLMDISEPLEMYFIEYELQCFAKKIKKVKPSGIFAYGAGGRGKQFLEIARMHNLSLTAFVDSNREKTGRIFEGLPVITPEEMHSRLNGGVVVITSVYKDEIIPTLKELGVPDSKILY